MRDRNLKQVVFKKTGLYYFAYTPYDLNLTMIGSFIDDAVPFLNNVIKFLHDDSLDSKGVQDFLIVKERGMILIYHDYYGEGLPYGIIKQEYLLKILEQFKKFAQEESPEITLSEDNGVYIMTSQGINVVIE